MNIKTEDLADLVTEAHINHRASLVTLADAERHLAQAEIRLLNARTETIAFKDASELGSNETQRKANIERFVFEEKATYQGFEAARDECVLQVTLAKSELDYLNVLVRLLAIEKGVSLA